MLTLCIQNNRYARSTDDIFLQDLREILKQYLQNFLQKSKRSSQVRKE